jgi:dienelactone hydrolase
MQRLPIESAAARAARFEAAGGYHVVTPAGRGPFPVVVHLHGCGGLRSLQRAYADAAADQGVASLIIDSYAPRRIDRPRAMLTVCTGLRLQGRERAGDLIAAVDWLSRQGWADASGIAAAGWSHGGWSVMEALVWGAQTGRFAGLAGLPSDPLPGLRLAFLVYPWCGFGAHTAARGWFKPVPTHMLLGGRDSLIGLAGPRHAMARLKRQSVPVAETLFATATHAFDDRDTGDPRFRFDPVLFAEARALFADTLRKGLLVA